MPRRIRLVPVAVLLVALLFVCGCGKKRGASPPANSTNQSAATQTNAGETSNPVSAPAAPNNTPDTSNQAPAPLTIPAGTPITVRLQERLSSASAEPGEHFDAVLDRPIVVDNQMIVPVGAPVEGHVVFARHSGRLHHPGELGLTLDSVTVDQQNISLVTSDVVARGGSHKKRNWAWIGGGGGGGALIGALAAGGKGALIGGPIGVAAGTATAFITGKKDVVFGSERRLRFRLDHEVNVAG
ncbi:MAG: hypothetical protein WCC92_01435 [Candidatus Korobacteraceae bacterium]